MLALLASCIVLSVPLTLTTESHRKWVLTWHDEFDGPAGRGPDPEKWTLEVGPHWYNNELQEYAGGTKNTFLDGKGHLVIEARNENPGGQPHYTSARMKTEGHFSQTYGRFEARIKVPTGQGIWPAFWALGNDLPQVGWPGCGELDVMELRGRQPSVLLGTAHGPGYSGGNGHGGKIDFKRSLGDDYHTYAIEWEPNQVRWFLDETNYFSLTSSDLQGHRWVFDHPFYMIMNLAVGGNFGGNPDSTTVFPNRMYVDYVRAYRAAP